MENNGNESDDGNSLTTTDVTLPMQLIHHIFDTYLGTEYKLLIHKDGSSDEDRSKVLSIELIMMWRMEDYFKNVLLSRKLKSRLCDEACKRGYVNTLQWAHANRCGWSSSTCSSAAMNGHLSCLQWARENGCPWDRNDCLLFAKCNNHTETVRWIESTAF